MSHVTNIAESVTIQASPAQVYAAITDLRQMSRWSPENRGATLLSPTSEQVQPGTSYWGHNRRRVMRWSTHCVVTVAVPEEHFAFAVGGLRMGERATPRFPFPIATWDYRLEATAGGTLVTETWTDERGSTGVGRFSRTMGQVLIGGRDFSEYTRANIRKSLGRLKDDLESVGAAQG